jgi:acyl-CoA dehydrogenase
MEWVPQCYGTADEVQLGAFCVSEPDAGSDVSSLRTRAVYDEAKDEWVLNGTKAWITNGGIADVHVVAAGRPRAEGPGPGQLHRAARYPRSVQGQKYKKHGIRRPTPPRWCSTTCACPARCLLGGKDKLDEKLAKAREALTKPARPVLGQAAGHGHLRGHPPRRGRQAIGIARAAYEYSLQYAQERTGVRQADHHEPGHRVHARRHGHRDRRRPPAGAPRRLAGRNGGYKNGEGSMSKLKAGRVAVWVTERRHPDPGRLRLHP